MRKVVRILARKSRAAVERACAQPTVTRDTRCDGWRIRIDAGVLSFRCGLRLTNTDEAKENRNLNRT